MRSFLFLARAVAARAVRLGALLGLATLAAACSMLQAPRVEMAEAEPVQVAPPQEAVPTQGAIFQAAQYRPLFAAKTPNRAPTNSGQFFSQIATRSPGRIPFLRRRPAVPRIWSR